MAGSTRRITGVLAAVVTPFKNDLSPDSERLLDQCRWLLSNDVGLAVFGTNSEANSLSIDEKIEWLRRLSRERAAIAHFGGDGSWVTVRPPLVELCDEQMASLVSELDGGGFAMAGRSS